MNPTITAELPAQSSTLPAKSAISVEKNLPDLPGDDLRFEWLTDADQLQSFVPAWQRLSEVAVEANIFYEPELLLPALRCLDAAGVRVAVATASLRKWPAGPRVMCGLFPVEISRRYHGLPIRAAKLWRHLHCFLTTPLVRPDVGRATLEGLFEFLSQGPEAVSVVEFPCVPAEGPFHAEWIDYLHASGRTFHVKSLERRALFRPANSSEEFLADWPRKRRHEITRLERRLQDQGDLQVKELKPSDDVDAWLDSFLQLERAGWKGEQGTALASNSQESQFLRLAAQELAAQGRLMGLSLELDGRPIAMKCNFLTRDGGFAFKIAFDEAWAKYSPGTILEKENVARLHARDGLTWMDSCAAPDHPMINSLWPQRRALQSVVVATDRRGGAAVVAAVPLMKWARDRFARKQN